MKIAVSTVCMPHVNLSESFNLARKAGFANVELLAFPGWKQFTLEDSSHAEDEASRSGLNIIGLHSGGIDGSTEDKTAADVAYVSRVIETAAKLGASIVVVNGMQSPVRETIEQRTGVLHRIRFALLKLAPLLEKHRVTLGLENHYRCQIETMRDYRIVLDGLELPRVGITLDTGHFTASGVDPAAFASEFGPRVVHVHLKDHIGPRSLPLGRGQTNNLDVVNALRQCGYDGFLSVEMEVEDLESTPRYLCEAMPYVRSLIS